jgi:hypothetical protein
MAAEHVSFRSTGFKYGLITAGACIIYFLIARASGFVNMTNFRFINYFILGVGISIGYIEVRHIIHKHRLNYLPGIILGFVMTFITAIVYTLFIFIYSRFIDLSFIPVISRDLPYYSSGLNAYIIGICIFFESMVVGVFLSFIVMQYFKRNRVVDEELDVNEEKANFLGEFKL